MLHVIAAQAIIILFLAGIVYVGEFHKNIFHRLATRIFGIGIIIAELVLMSLIVYAKEANVGYTHLLLVHFWIILITFMGLAMYGLIKALIILVNPIGEELAEEESKEWKKWRR